jgi:hypothetical protein
MYMHVSAFHPVALVLLLNLAAAELPPREPASDDFRLVTEVSRTVVRAHLPVTVFANFTNRSDYSWNGIAVSIDATDKIGNPILNKVFDGQAFESHGSKSCSAVFRFEEPDQVVIRVALSRRDSGKPFFVRENVARIAVTPIDVTGEATQTKYRDGCR